MPTSKRVHFLDPVTNTILSPAPLTPPVIPFSPFTPSPTFSGSSLSASTPPTTPTAFYPSPSRILGNTVQVHPAISYNDRSPPLYFDVALSPSMLPSQSSSSSSHLRPSLLPYSNHLRSTSLGFDPAVLYEPATYPPLPSITIMSELLPWSIHVEASQVSHIPVVTVYDVLQTLYITLHIPIVPCEWTCLQSMTQNMISATFYRRIDSIPDHHVRESQRRKGVRRMDYLTGRTRLLGIRPVTDKYGVFVVSWGSL